ncbi:MAG: 3-deoxy-D-manno-octulosonic acid transferase [Proteobacteria bacterium]|nr:3-deoxy-D-manno-octulosonic acid transferase [Pseudomonadota bacterium]
MMYLYNLLLSLFFPFYIMIFYPMSFIKKKWKKGFFVKLGYYKNRDNIKNPYVFHCVSVGESLATIPLVKRFLKTVSDNVLFTVTTLTGYNIAKEKIGKEVKEITFFPMDFPFTVNKFFKTFRPGAIIISETEIWPNIIFFSRLSGIPVIFINGRISDKSFRKYIKFSWFFSDLLKYPFFIMQNEEYKERVIKMGADEKKVFISGNIKYDMAGKESLSREETGIKDDDLVLIAGSTHPHEEKIVLDSYKRLRDKNINIKLIIAPRHPERFKEVEQLIISYGFKTGKRSFKDKVWDVFLLDTIGELFSFYSLCDIAFVGGSLTNIGGHNILEPAYFSKPVIFGRYMNNFSEIRDEFLKKNAGYEVTEENIFDTLFKLINDRSLRTEMGLRAKEIVNENSGSLQKTLDLIKGILVNA